MATATVTTKTYKAHDVIKLNNYETFTWQAVKKIADEMGVKFYSQSSRYENDGLGLKLGRFDKTQIRITGYERAHSDNWYTNSRLKHLSTENFMLKLELWGLKNNIKFEYTPAQEFQDAYIRIVKVGA